MNFLLAVVAVPNVIFFTIACSIPWIPHLPVDTLKTNTAIPVVRGLANAFSAVPDLPTDTTCGLTPAVAQVSSLWAYTLIFHVSVLPSCTSYLFLTVVSVPESLIRTLTLKSKDIPLLSVSAFRHVRTSKPVPPCSLGALTGKRDWVEYFPSKTRNTSLGVPEHSSWALTLIVQDIERLTSWALLHTRSTVPKMAVPTNNANFFLSRVSVQRAVLNASMVVAEGVSWAIRAL